ncbi:DUF4976 domain-containing protein [Segetibacter sp. 3557_3]|nr:DUF4976 domain-containing protein [Segetibacter sp. 3557_3]
MFILADDLGYGDLGCYGQSKVRTPNIDRLAKGGLKFTQFYAGSTVCAPSRASLLTGLHTGHTAVRGNKGMKPEGQFPLPASAKTFPSRLQQLAYTTAAFGKWGMGYITTTGDPQKQGFDEFYGYNCQTLAHNYFPDHLWHNHERIDLAGNLKTDSVYSADLIQQQAMAFLAKKQSRPFFLYLPYTLPHADVVVPHDSVYTSYVKQFNEAPVKPPTGKGDGEVHHYDEHPHAAFASMVSRLDSYVGQIMTQLEKSGMDKNTLVIFSSDNGPHKEHGGDPEFFNSSGGLKGIKRDLFEGGIRVPFIASWKGVIKPGVTSQLATFWDMYPTVEEIAGGKPTKNIDGISFLPVLKGLSQKEQRPYLYWEFHEGTGKQAVRWKNWKAIRLNAKSPNSLIELYDLSSDPAEQKNVAGTNKTIVDKMSQLMQEAHVPNADWPFLAGETAKKQ